ncbi:DUF4857 domain-containing protein [Geovibrio thiophilus]|uniref:DUF4857 domain-containing protein n=1 Tax=Geovibrio thiophilus TaxID=139438 RepID=A0A3R5UVM1_9BACT|nr:DUF4857 domain-containing protein [Geovibrio thiophilus]QAR33786.1 DUF4857 domain-containing protein [Geovibrio thiophilus]
MKYISRYLLLIAAVISFSSLIPYLYSTVFGKRAERPAIFYSKVIEDIVYSLEDRSGSRKYYDGAGNEYSAKEYTRLIPFIQYRDLQKWGMYPDIVGGEYVSVEQAASNRDFVNIHSYWIDGEKVRIKLYPLFESDSDFTKVEMPSELFRINSRMEFINGVKNAVDEEKSVLFTEALRKEGFVFPPKMIAGNPTTKKPYDFGYFVQDGAGEMFHLMQVKGQPSVKKTGIKPEDGILYIAVKEDMVLPYYGFLLTTGGGVYHIMKEGYELKKLPVENYRPLEQTFRYIKDPLNMMVKISDEFGENVYVADKNYNLEKKAFYPYERRLRGVFRAVYDSVFPFEINTKNPDRYGSSLNIEFSEKLPAAFIFSAVLAVFYAALMIFSGRRNRTLPYDTALVLAGGIYAVFALVLLDGFGRNKI